MSAPARRKPRRNEAQLAFDALYIEGGLLAPEWLARVARLDAGGQAEADYRVPKGLNLRDEIGRFWRIAQAQWADFAAGRAANAESRALAERFVGALLRDVFGFASLSPIASVALAERTYPIGFAALGKRVPVVIAAAGSGLDTPSPAFGEGGRRRSAFGLVQDFLNAAEGAMWGVSSDGVTLRIVRDNASLTRPAWIETDLGRIFTEERYADFAALWLLLHETRFGEADQPVAECALETWRNAGKEEGTRAREHLRRGVEDALAALGHGFVSHPDNTALRASLQDGSLKDREFFNQLLRLVYRVIFLLTVEERGLLHPDGTPDVARELYAHGYSLRRLRERSAKRSAHDRHADLWAGTTIVFAGAAAGEARLGLPALAGIFASGQCPALDAAKLENRALLLAVFKLSWLRDSSGLARVNWRDMGPEELGSVYESLLELVPVVSVATRSFAFAKGDETKGNARKTSGSYYTPDSLVQVLLDSALEPVVTETIAANPGNPVDALLSLSIVDPACGSGHFLLAAARRLAAHVARLQANGTPSAAEYRRALRQVVGRCIYGVDLNLMAVELCKVALWMEAVEPGLPLTFLDAHIQHGNALLGTTPDLMAKGIPDAAWEPIEGDDRKVASALKKRNGKEASGQTTMSSLWSKPATAESDEVTRAVADLEAASDADAGALAAKESRWAGILASGAFRHQKFVADAWCAAFVWPKPSGGGPVVEAAPTMGLWRDLRDGRGQPPGLTVATTEELSAQYHFFHWHLAFPTVFGRGGFDVVLGNPPWERLKLQEEEWFAAREPAVAAADNAADRRAMIARLRTESPEIARQFSAGLRVAEAEPGFLRQSGAFPLCGVGRDINTAAVFLEVMGLRVASRGMVGCITPASSMLGDTTKEFVGALVGGRRLRAVYHFENEALVFANVHHAFRFCLVVISGAGIAGRDSQLVFYARRVEDLQDQRRRVTLSSDDLVTLNPITRTLPAFRSSRDADIALRMHRFVVALSGSAAGTQRWTLRTRPGHYHMSNDAELFLQGSVEALDDHDLVPLFESKMITGFDPRFGTYSGQTSAQSNQGKLPETTDLWHGDPSARVLPRYFVRSAELASRASGLWSRKWCFALREITSATSERTAIAAILPHVATGHTLTILMDQSAAAGSHLLLLATLNCLTLDYAARQKVNGTHLVPSVIRQLPILPPRSFHVRTAWAGATVADWLFPRVLELTYTAWDLEPFAKDVGYDGPPFRWDPARRFLLRAELDAAFFHLYGLDRDDTAYILDTFPIVRKNNEKAHGEYRTKRVILEVYDAMAGAARTGVPYVTRLDPPPADPRVAHPPRPTPIS